MITPGDGPAVEFYYDGKTMMAYAPAENVVAVADAPPTIDAALKAAYESAAIYFPFTDVVVADPYADIAEGLKHAFYIGQSHVVGGTTTDMVAIADDQVFAQLWIGAEDKLPRRIRAVYLRRSVAAPPPGRALATGSSTAPCRRTRSPRRARRARRASRSRGPTRRSPGAGRQGARPKASRAR